VLWRLKLFKLVYAFGGLCDWRRWHAEHRYRLAQARSQFTGGNTPLDKLEDSRSLCASSSGRYRRMIMRIPVD